MTIKAIDVDLETTRAQLEKLAWSLAPTAPMRQPSAHLILASRRNLERKFGAAGFHTLNQSLLRLAGATQRDLVYLDDPVSLSPLGATTLDTPEQAQAWAAWLDHTAPRTESILLIGGPDLAPFGRVANPSDDDDEALASDARLAGTRPLAPQRAIGRLPDADDLQYLIHLIEMTREAHAASRRAYGLWGLPIGRPLSGPPAIGYTASVWRHSARAVFASLGAPQRLRMSPPLDHHLIPPLEADAFCPAYFNLHGLRDEAGWYGQRDPLLAADYAHFPLALRPEILTRSRGGHRLIVFSAACYGGYIEGKQAETSLALRFLDTQAAAFIGSTALAYGGLSEPLQASDQLARLFWDGVQMGWSVGEALRRAKLGLVEEMTRRQAYLDAEDQKAILTFTLYGDPTLIPFPRGREGDKETRRQGDRGQGKAGGAQVKVIPHRAVDIALPADMLRRVEREVRERLPDLGPVAIRAALPLQCKAVGDEPPALTLTMAETSLAGLFRHVVKVTVDPQGSVTRLVMAHGGSTVMPRSTAQKLPAVTLGATKSPTGRLRTPSAPDDILRTAQDDSGKAWPVYPPFAVSSSQGDNESSHVLR